MLGFRRPGSVVRRKKRDAAAEMLRAMACMMESSFGRCFTSRSREISAVSVAGQSAVRNLDSLSRVIGCCGEVSVFPDPGMTGIRCWELLFKAAGMRLTDRTQLAGAAPVAALPPAMHKFPARNGFQLSGGPSIISAARMRREERLLQTAIVSVRNSVHENKGRTIAASNGFTTGEIQLFMRENTHILFLSHAPFSG